MTFYKVPDNLKASGFSLHSIEPEYSFLLPNGWEPISEEEAQLIRRQNYQSPPAPTKVPIRKARKILRSAGLLGQIEELLNAIPGEQGANARDDWEYSSEIDRGNPTFQLLAQGLGLTEQQIDELMIAADALP